MTRHFNKLQRIEQFRALESAGDRLDRPVDVPDGASFPCWLHQRVTTAALDPKVEAALCKPRHLYKRSVALAAAVTFVLGYLSVSSLLGAQSPTLNIFWLLGALLGVNALTLALWLVFMLLPGGQNRSLLGGLLEWLLARLFVRKRTTTAAGASASAWFLVAFSAPLEKWRLAVLSHSVWVCFLAGNFASLLVSFTTRQFDFIWESTLLSPSAISPIFSVLAAPIGALHLPVPEYFDAAAATPASRQAWAWFVLSSLGVYALLPRLLALATSKAVLRHKERRWHLDLSLPYYIHLKHKFSEGRLRSKVLDEETSPAPQAATQLQFSTIAPPENAQWLGLELVDAARFRALTGELSACLNGLAAVTDFCQKRQHNSQPLVICVEGSRPPDRGTVRNLRALAGDAVWLAVLSDGPLPLAKQQAWLGAAETAGIAATQTLLLGAAS